MRILIEGSHFDVTLSSCQGFHFASAMAFPQIPALCALLGQRQFPGEADPGPYLLDIAIIKRGFNCLS